MKWKNQAGTSTCKPLHELTNSTPVTPVLVKDNAAVEKQPLTIIVSQTSVQKNSTVIPVNTAHEADFDADILVMPKPHIRKKRGRSLEEKFFILTSEEAYAAKVKQKEEKEKAEAEKRKRQERRNELKRDKENQTAAVPSAVAAVSKTGRQKKSKEDRTKCMYCEIEYWESAVGWLKCKNCKQWACMKCAHLTRNKKAYVCDSCRYM